MVGARDNLRLAVEAIRAHKLRAALTVLGLTMGVATLMTVMTLVQGANLYVEQKIANLGTNVFRLAKTPFAVVDFTVVVKALEEQEHRYRRLSTPWPNCAGPAKQWAHPPAARFRCSTRTSRPTTPRSSATRPTWSISTRARWIWGATSPPAEDRHAAYVCVIGASLVDQFFPA